MMGDINGVPSWGYRALLLTTGGLRGVKQLTRTLGVGQNELFAMLCGKAD